MHWDTLKQDNYSTGRGDGGSSAGWGTSPTQLPPCPSIRVLSYSNCQRSSHSMFQRMPQKFSTLRVNWVSWLTGICNRFKAKVNACINRLMSCMLKASHWPYPIVGRVQNLNLGHKLNWRYSVLITVTLVSLGFLPLRIHIKLYIIKRNTAQLELFQPGHNLSNLLCTCHMSWTIYVLCNLTLYTYNFFNT